MGGAFGQWEWPECPAPTAGRALPVTKEQRKAGVAGGDLSIPDKRWCWLRPRRECGGGEKWLDVGYFESRLF